MDKAIHLSILGFCLTVGVLASLLSEDGPPTDPCLEAGPLAKKVSLSLTLDPEQWSSDGYYLSNNDRGVSFWIASGARHARPQQVVNSDHWPPGMSSPATASQLCLLQSYEEWRATRQYEPEF